MQVEPVRSIQTPTYPRRSELLVDRTILDRQQPRAWRVLGGFAGAVAVLLAAQLTGCSDDTRPPAANDPFADPGPSVAAASAWVESIFDDGWSRGSLACVIVAPPIYFSEDEALPESAFEAFRNLGAEKE